MAGKIHAISVKYQRLYGEKFDYPDAGANVMPDCIAGLENQELIVFQNPDIKNVSRNIISLIHLSD